MIEDQKKNVAVMKLVMLFMTPFAVGLVLMGLAFGRPGPEISALAVAIVLATSLGNLYAVHLLSRYPSRALVIRNARVGFNYAFNLWLIFILLPTWKPIWMLFLLTIIAVAVYEDRQATVVHAALFTFMLFYAAFKLDLLKGVFFGELAMEAATIWFVGLFLNRLTEIETAPPSK